MATSAALSQGTLVVDSVDFSDQATSIMVSKVVEALEATAFGDPARKFKPGLGNYEVSATLFLSYGTGEVEEKLASLVGTVFDVVATPTTSVTPGTDNPEWSLTGCYLEQADVINSSVGELPTIDVVFRGGSLARATS